MISLEDPPHIRHLTRQLAHAIVELYGFMLKKLVFLSAWFSLTPVLILVVVFSLNSHQNIQKPNLVDSLKITEVAVDNTIDGQVLGTKIQDARPLIVERFLSGTPLGAYSEQIVEVSDKYAIDYRLIPAIAMKESGGGASIDVSTHNAWGFENGKTTFSSWESAIDVVGKTLKIKYIDRGLTTPDQIMAIYAPPQLLTGGRWARDVNFFFSQMESL